MLRCVLELLFAVIGVGLGATSVLLTQRARREARLRKTSYGWDDIHREVARLVQTIERDFTPDMIVCSSGGSVGIIANLYLALTERFIPAYFGVSRRFDKGTPFTSTPIFHARYQTERWETFLPDGLTASGASRVLILEDAVITGESMDQIRRVLAKEGFASHQIRTAAPFVTEYAFRSKKEPDYWRQRVSDQIFHFPWGANMGKSFD